jgi:hypothetical protein
MKTATALATTLFAIASFPLTAQQAPATNQPDSPATQQNLQARRRRHPLVRPRTRQYLP